MVAKQSESGSSGHSSRERKKSSSGHKGTRSSSGGGGIRGQSRRSKHKESGGAAAAAGGNGRTSSESISGGSASSWLSNFENRENYAWLGLFFPALCYYLLVCRSGDGDHRRGGFKVVSSQCEGWSCAKIFPGATVDVGVGSQDTHSYVLSYPVEEAVHGRPRTSGSSSSSSPCGLFRHLTSPRWIHDSELGRGYLLFSDAIGNRIWRWEVGGGPIALGRSLHMERSGCRSRPGCVPPDDNCSAGPVIGSAALAVDADDRLLVSELGEGRLVRVEADGARTPLMVPAPRVTGMVYAPRFGDLVYTDTGAVGSNGNDRLLALRDLSSIKPVPQSESRAAHSLIRVVPETGVNLLYHGYAGDGDGGAPRQRRTTLSSVALSPDRQSVYIMERRTFFAGEDDTEKIGSDHLLVVKVGLELDEDYDDDDDENDEDDENDSCVDDEGTSCLKMEEDKGICPSQVFFNATHLLPADDATSSSVPLGGLVTDTTGRVYLALHPVGVIVLSPDGDHIGTLPLPFLMSEKEKEREILTDLTLGSAGDHYLYITTNLRVLRVRTHYTVSGLPDDNDDATPTSKGSKKLRTKDWRVRCGTPIDVVLDPVFGETATSTMETDEVETH